MTAPTKQPLPRAEQTSPYGDDVEEAAALLVDRARADVADQTPLDRFDSVGWWRLVHLRTAELLHDVTRGEPLAELAQQYPYRQIESMLAEQGTRVSDSTISKLIGAWKRWTAGAPQR